MKNLEDQIQIAAMRYIRTQYPNVISFHVANERATSPMRGAKLKKMGVMSGVADIVILEARGEFHGMLIELKAPKGRLTETQKDFLNRAQKKGYYTDVCYSFAEVKLEVDLYMNLDNY